MLVTPNESKPLILKAMKARLPIMLSGSPGTAKSATAYDIAESLNLVYMPIYLATRDILAVSGYPSISDTENGKRAEYVPFNLFPLEGDVVPDGKKGFLVVLEELPACPMMMQIAAYAILLERRVGDAKLHKNCFVLATGNLASDKAGVKPISTAMQSRMAHLNIHLPAKEWLTYALDKGVNQMITSFIEWKPSMLNNFNPAHSDSTYACARTWSMLNSMLGKPKDVPAMRALIDGTVGQSASSEFIAFTRFYSKIPKIADIIMNPLTAPLVEDGIAYALSGSIADAMDTKNVKALCQYVERLPMEIQVVTVRRTAAVNPDLLDHPIMDALAEKVSSKL